MWSLKTFFISFFILIACVMYSQELDTDDINEDIEHGNYIDAIKKLQNLLMVDSTNSIRWYELGKLQQKAQLYNNAVSSLSRAYEIEPQNEVVLLALAKVNSLAGKAGASVRAYRKLLDSDSLNVAALLNLASIYYRKEAYNGAFLLYERLHQIDTMNAEYLRKMAICKMKVKEVDPAFEYLKEAYSVDSANIHVVDMLGKVYISFKKFDTALMIINKAIAVYPDEGKLYALRGYTHYKRNHHYRSVPDLQKALELGILPSSNVKKNLGASLFALKRYAEARDVLEQLLFPDTVDYQVCIYLGNVYNELGDTDKGIVFFNKSLEIQQPSPLSMSATYRGLQTAYHKKGLYYKEIEMIKMRKEVLGQEFYSPMYLAEIANVYENGIKNKQTALKYYEKYYDEIKDWYPEEGKNRIEIKINRLKEDIHFEK